MFRSLDFPSLQAAIAHERRKRQALIADAERTVQRAAARIQQSRARLQQLHPLHQQTQTLLQQAHALVRRK